MKKLSLLLSLLILVSGCVCNHIFYPIKSPRNTYAIQAKYFEFDCYSPFYADKDELHLVFHLRNADSSKQIIIVRSIPVTQKETDSLKYVGFKGGVDEFRAKGNIKKTKLLNLSLQYSVVENNRRDTIIERFTLRKRRSCLFVVH